MEVKGSYWIMLKLDEAATRTSRYEARYSTNNDSTYAYIVRIGQDGFVQVLLDFRPRHFANRKNAEKAVAKHFAKFLSS